MATTNPTTTALPAANRTTAPAATTPGAGATAPAATGPQLAQEFARTIPVTLTGYDQNKGPVGSLANGISDLSVIIGTRQTRLNGIMAAIANDANKNGVINQLALVRAQMESATTDHMSSFQKSLYDKLSNSVQVWTRMQ